MDKETIIISLGGSLIVPDEIDISFLKVFKSLISKEVQKGKKFFVITGGGKLCRKYQNVAKELSEPTDFELDMIGIKALNLNAELVRTIFKDTEAVNVFGAEKPGSSTDLGAVLLAKEHKAKIVVNLSNIDYVYDSDPKKNLDAKKLEKISWADYRALIPKAWSPGLNSPFDPVASELAEKEGIEVVIMNGNIENLQNFLDGKDFKGTRIM